MVARVFEPYRDNQSDAHRKMRLLEGVLNIEWGGLCRSNNQQLAFGTLAIDRGKNLAEAGSAPCSFWLA
jgi:hypothetical protein